jgi:hypothetical protein
MKDTKSKPTITPSQAFCMLVEGVNYLNRDKPQLKKMCGNWGWRTLFAISRNYSIGLSKEA